MHFVCQGVGFFVAGAISQYHNGTVPSRVRLNTVFRTAWSIDLILLIPAGLDNVGWFFPARAANWDFVRLWVSVCAAQILHRDLEC